MQARQEQAVRRTMVSVTARKSKLSTSLEDYLEAILHLVRRQRVARVRDIARRLGVHMPSVTAALKVLAQRKLVNYDPYQFITLTESGQRAAQEVTRRHRVLRDFLTGVLGLDDSRAEANACRMEHAVDQVVLDRLGDFARFVERSGRWDKDWIDAVGRFHKDVRGSRPGRRRAPGGRAAPVRGEIENGETGEAL